VQRPAGRSTTHTYDSGGQLTEVKYEDGSGERFAYDAAGALSEAHNDSGTILLTRDPLGRLVREDQASHWIVSTYDVRGQRTQLSSSLGATAEWRHDALGNLSTVQAGEHWKARMLHDAQGLELQRQLSGGLRVGWQRDSQGRPTQQYVAAGAEQRQRRYMWQGTDQLAALEDNLTGTTSYTYDPAGTLTGATYGDNSQDVRLADAVGNLFRSPTFGDRQYTPGGQLRQAGGTRYRYDAEGNLIQKITSVGQVWQYTWNSAGHLSAVILSNGYTVSFTYDALGRRLSKHYRGRVTRWVWDGHVPLHEWHELEVGPGAGSVRDLTT